MVVDVLVVFIVVAGIFISVARQRDKLIHPVFRKPYIFELPLYLAVVASVLVFASQVFGSYIHWIPGLLTLIAIPFARMGYPNFLKIWRER